MQIRPFDLAIGVNVVVSFSTTALPSANHCDVLIVSAHARTGIGSGNNLDAAYIQAMARAALTMNRPAALIFDFRDFEYEWGDMMCATLAAGDKQYVNSVFPTVVIVSDKCRKGLTSLIKEEMQANPADWLFEDFESALEAVDQQRQLLLKRI
jgi:hypothetical protein